MNWRLVASLFVFLGLALQSGMSPTPVAATVTRQKAERCMYWQSKVDASVDRPYDPKMHEPDERIILEAIECLLTLEGNRRHARIGGATHFAVSRMIFEEVPVEVAALFYISYLYYQKWDHANAVLLVDLTSDGSNTPQAARRAYQYYRAWFKEIKKVGLAKARKRGLDPLQGNDVRWY